MFRNWEGGDGRAGGGCPKGGVKVASAHSRPAVVEIHITILCEGGGTLNNTHVARDEPTHRKTRGQRCNGGATTCIDEVCSHIIRGRGRIRGKAVAFDIE